MSRIFEACRQYLKSGAGEPLEPAQPTPEVFAFPELRPKLAETFPPVTCPPSSDDRLVACGGKQNLGLEKFHLLAHRLAEMRSKWPVKVLTVCSCVSKEGKTVVAINLALTLAANPGRVLLIDGDLRRQGAGETLRLKGLPGLAEYLEGGQAVESAVRRIEPHGIFYVPAGQTTRNPFDLLQGPLIPEFVQRLAPMFDWVIIDSPPLVPFADGYCLAKNSDAALLVVRPGVTPKDAVEKAIAGLEGVRIAGVVWNASEETRRDRHYYDKYYAGAGSRARSSANGKVLGE